MQVPSLDTWLAGERATAAKLNKNIRDFGNFVKGPPFAWAWRNAAYNTPTAWTDISLDSEKYDNDNMFSGSGNLTVQTPGYYRIEGQVRWTSNATVGWRAARIKLGSLDLDTQYMPNVAGAAATQIMAKCQSVYYCNAGDQIILGAAADAGAASYAAHVGVMHYTFLRAMWVAA